MQIAPTILSDIKNSVLITHDNEADFIQLADLFSAESGVDYQNDTAGAYTTRLPDYLKRVNAKGMILLFFKLYILKLNAAQQAFPSVLLVKNTIDHLFEEKNGRWQIADKHFNSCLVNKHYAFLDRKPVREAVRRMVVDKDSPVLIMSGLSKAGLSYTRLFLSDCEVNFNPYKLIDINLKNDVSGYADGLIYAAHLAQFIVDRLQMPHVIDLEKAEQFKIAPFITRLKAFLESREQTYLFFIDQFDVPLSDDVFSLITGLAKLPMGKFNTFLILAGYNKVAEWGFELEHNCNKVDIQNGHVTKEHVNDFFENVYSELTLKFNGVPAIEDFFAMVSGMITDEDFALELNVSLIGQRLSTWYKNLYEKIKNDAKTNN